MLTKSCFPTWQSIDFTIAQWNILVEITYEMSWFTILQFFFLQFTYNELMFYSHPSIKGGYRIFFFFFARGKAALWADKPKKRGGGWGRGTQPLYCNKNGSIKVLTISLERERKACAPSQPLLSMQEALYIWLLYRAYMVIFVVVCTCTCTWHTVYLIQQLKHKRLKLCKKVE